MLFDLVDANSSQSITAEELREMIVILQDTELSEQIAQVSRY